MTMHRLSDRRSALLVALDSTNAAADTARLGGFPVVRTTSARTAP